MLRVAYSSSLSGQLASASVRAAFTAVLVGTLLCLFLVLLVIHYDASAPGLLVLCAFCGYMNIAATAWGWVSGTHRKRDFITLRPRHCPSFSALLTRSLFSLLTSLFASF